MTTSSSSRTSMTRFFLREKTCPKTNGSKTLMSREAAGELQPLLHSTSDSMIRKLVVANDTTIDMDAAQVGQIHNQHGDNGIGFEMFSSTNKQQEYG